MIYILILSWIIFVFALYWYNQLVKLLYDRIKELEKNIFYLMLLQEDKEV